MTGVIAQLIALTAYGNDYLRNGNLPADFNSTNTTFQFCQSIDFRESHKTLFFLKTRVKVVAENPAAWFKQLKAENCQRLRLYFQDSEGLSSGKDYRDAGLVGGGGTWLIEAVYDQYSDYWSNNWTVKNQNADDGKIWAVHYGISGTKQPGSDLQIDNQHVKDKFRHILTDIAGFAYKHNLQVWGGQFDTAKATLDSLHPNELYYYKDLIPLDNYSLIAKQLVFTAGSSWVFSGMGSWIDLGFDTKEDTERYNRLSEDLYSCLVEAIISAINTF